VGGSRPLRRHKALYAASKAISVAQDHRAIVDAIGEHLSGSASIHVTLWQAERSAEHPPLQFHLLAAWVAPNLETPDGEMVLDARELALLARLRGGEPISLRSTGLAPAERAAWNGLGARTALLVPLTDAQRDLVGLLILASPAGRVSGQAAKHARLLGPQVAQAMENVRLIQGARQAAIFEERQRLAREIHDTLAQDLAGIVVHLEAAEEALTDVPDRPGARVLPHIGQAKAVAREGLEQARKLVWALRPDILEGTPLASALERAAAQWAQEAALPVEVVVTGEAVVLPPEAQVTLLRVLQEALSNVRKHARAHEVTVTLSFMRGVVALDVQDDGRGFEPGRSPVAPATPDGGGFGLTAMHERVEQLGGTLLIESAPGEGTTVVAEIPTDGGRARWEPGPSDPV
jgi:signal transduction histidine kinase